MVWGLGGVNGHPSSYESSGATFFYPTSREWHWIVLWLPNISVYLYYLQIVHANVWLGLRCLHCMRQLLEGFFFGGGDVSDPILCMNCLIRVKLSYTPIFTVLATLEIAPLGPAAGCMQTQPN